MPAGFPRSIAALASRKPIHRGGKHVLRRCIATALAAVGVLLAAAGTATATEAEDGYSAAQIALFATPHLSNIEQPGALVYGFERRGTLAPAIDDTVELTVTRLHRDGGRDVSFAFLHGPNARPFPDIEGFRGNPVLMAFLQRDVEEMERLTGGKPGYFRNRIRRAFHDAARVEAVSITWAGRETPARRITVRPYVGAPLADRFPELVGKTYEFVVSEDVPGGIYRIRTRVDGGTVRLEEAMTLRAFEEK